MISKAEKLRKLRQRQAAGRPKLPGERYPSGDRKRSETREETLSVATEARMRQHGVQSVIFKGRDLAGFTLGRMHLDKKITEPELEAGLWYCEIVARYFRSIGLRPLSPQAQDLLEVRGGEEDLSESAQERAKKATDKFTSTETALGKVGNGVKSTVWNVCVMDMENLRMMPEHQLRMLRGGLRALAVLRGLPDD